MKAMSRWWSSERIIPIVSSATATELFDGLYTIANLQGQTVVVASGDAGNTDCAPDLPTVAVNALASSPHAVAVGGTALDAGFQWTPEEL